MSSLRTAACDALIVPSEYPIGKKMKQTIVIMYIVFLTIFKKYSLNDSLVHWAVGSIENIRLIQV